MLYTTKSKLKIKIENFVKLFVKDYRILRAEAKTVSFVVFVNLMIRWFIVTVLGMSFFVSILLEGTGYSFFPPLMILTMSLLMFFYGVLHTRYEARRNEEKNTPKIWSDHYA